MTGPECGLLGKSEDIMFNVLECVIRRLDKNKDQCGGIVMVDLNPLVTPSGTNDTGPIVDGVLGGDAADAKLFQQQLNKGALSMFIGPIMDAASAATEESSGGDSE